VFFDEKNTARLFLEEDLNFHTGLDADAGDLLHDLGGRVKVDHALVNAHLEPVPGVGTFTARGLAGGEPEGLGGEPHGARHAEPLVESRLLEVRADLFEGLDVPGGERDANAVHLGLLRVEFLLGHHLECLLLFWWWLKKRI